MRKQVTLLFLLFLNSLIVFYFYRENTVDFNIDASIRPDILLKPNIPFEINTYEDISPELPTTSNSISDIEDNIDYNKIYYYQRIAYAKSVADKEVNNKNTAQAQGIPIEITKIENKTTSKQQQKNTPVYKTTTIDTEQYEYLISQAETWLGIPYVWGGNSRNGTDCSGFVQQLYRSLGVNLPRTSKEQSKKGLLVSRDELLPGDLLFFDTHSARNYSDITTPTQEMINAKEVEDGYRPNEVSHVGMYVGNGQMIHASSGAGYIKYENIETKYYMTRFLNARRILIPKNKE